MAENRSFDFENTTISSHASQSFTIPRNSPQVDRISAIDRVSTTERVEEVLTFEKFISGDVRKMTISVVGTERQIFKHLTYKIEVKSPSFQTFYCLRRYNEFYALHKALRIKYENLELPSFPSKYQLINKVETRKAQFHAILNRVLEIAVKHAKIQNNLMKTLYAFLAKDISGTKNAPKPGGNQSTPSTSKKDLEKKALNQNSTTRNTEEDSEEDDSLVDHFARALADDDNSSFIEKKAKPEGLVDSPAKEVPKYTRNSERVSSMVESRPEIKPVETLELPESQRKQHKSLVDNKQILAIPRNSRKMTDLSEVQEDKNELLKEESKENLKKEIENIRKKMENAGAEGIQKIKEVMEKGKNKLIAAADNNLIVRRNKEVLKSPGHSRNPSDTKIPKAPKTKPNTAVYQGIVDEDFNLEYEINNLAGDIWVKFRNDTKWSMYYGKLINSNIYLFSSVLENNHECIITLFGTDVEIIKSNDILFIEFNHNYDCDKIQLTIDPDNQMRRLNTKEIYTEIKRWYFQIKIAKQKGTDLDFEEAKFQPIGKIYLDVVEAVNIKGLTPNSTVMVRVKHNPYSFQTKRILANENPRWRQKMLLPISDTYFSIKFEVITVFNDGWIKEHQKEEIYGTAEILVADIMSSYLLSNLKVRLPIDLNDNRKKTAKTAGKEEQEKNVVDYKPYLIVKLRNLSTVLSWFSSPHYNYIEGMKYDKNNVNKGELKMCFNRIKRIVSNVNLKISSFDDILRFKYPKFSTYFFLISGVIGIFIDFNQLLSYIIMIFMILTLYQHPFLEEIINVFLNKKFFSNEHLNKSYVEPLIQTVEQVETKKSADIQRFKMKIKDKESMYTKYQAMKKSIAKLQIALTNICNFFEKLKNLTNWSDPQKTGFFLVFLIVIYTFTSTLPLRFFFITSLISKFFKGKKWYKVTYERNKLYTQTILEFIIRKFFPKSEYVKCFEQNLEWPAAGVNFKAFEKKLIEMFRTILQIQLPENVLTTYKKTEEFINFVSTCDYRLRVNSDFDDIVLREMIRRRKIKRIPLDDFILKKFAHFIYNIPSDYYRLLHPRRLEIAE